MEISEIADLIKIREYMQSVSGNYNVDKKTINEVSVMITLLDNKILTMLQSQDFKDFVGFDEFKKEKEDARQKNIVSGAESSSKYYYK